jgi:para-aminobenzoate synthetase/4-amino-4-deoxychorismate lyase
VPAHRPILVLADFADEPAAAPIRRRFEAPVWNGRAATLDDVLPLIDEAERRARAGLWVAGFVSYDAAAAFDAAFEAAAAGEVPLAWFAAFESFEVEYAADSATGSGHSTIAPEGDDGRSMSGDGKLVIDAGITQEAYDRGVERIREHIAAGDVYQVNLTVPFRGNSTLSPLALWERMRRAQAGAYSAYLDIGDLHVMSASPELFFERSDGVIRSRPMKGTARRGPSAAADAAARQALLESEKDRAENVMIVDVVRNDLGRIARIGTVRVPTLCAPERYPRVWQLTSTVEAEVDPAVPLSSVFKALFPPASVTGAPKVRATRIIRELEARPRAIYCGAIGLIRPGGDATFNVAIRTAWSADDGHTVRLDAGGGVTIDSTAAGELAELRAKLVAFTEPVLRPALFETIRLERGQPVRLERHLARIGDSAAYFGIPFDASLARDEVARAGRMLHAVPVSRCRLVLDTSGRLEAAAVPFEDESATDPPRPVMLAREPVDRRDVRLYHKTTDRAPYERALSALRGGFDVLLWNQGREATELSRGNLVAEIDGVRWTPHVSSGLLAGTLRAELIESGAIRERVLYLDELGGADRLWFINSLRGWIPISLGA